jgi:hypothetical protein
MFTNTSLYEFSHGHKPRGRGRWMFEVAWYSNTTDQTGSDICGANGTMAEARSAATRSLKERRGNSITVTEVTVLP